MSDFDFTGKIAIVTGAGGGLGRAHALGLASRGAKVVVNDLAAADGSTPMADAVVAEIVAAGGEAVANGANVANMDQVEAMVASVMDKWGRIDFLINNAGILRDKSFVKGTLDDFKLVGDVHLMGSVNCTKAVWEIMRTQNFGRIVMTSSSSGLYGNFGQANYGAAKMAVVGFMNTLAQEGAKYNIRVNSLAPAAATQMTEGLIPEDAMALLEPEKVTPAVLFMCGTNAPTRTIICAAAGGFATTRIYETKGMFLPDDNRTPEAIAENWEAISTGEGQVETQSGGEQTIKFVGLALEGMGLA
jgi:NAD(P)-dependent dehydrogenase (short-subunit alcohol dehydrogenase family)